MLAKWLALSPKILIFDEPTRGVDVGAKAEIYAIMRTLAENGVAVMMISSDMEEVLALSDRIAVMHEGRISGILPQNAFGEEAIMRLAVGGAATEAVLLADAAQRGSGMKKALLGKEFGLFVLLVVLSLTVWGFNHQFLSAVNIQNTARLIGLYGILVWAWASSLSRAALICRSGRCSRFWACFWSA